MTALNVDEVRKRCEGATSGPWRLCAHLRPGCDCTCGYRGGIWSGDGASIVCEMGNDPDDKIPPPPLTCEQLVRDAAFIANARSDLPAALARIAELEAELAAERDMNTALVGALGSICEEGARLTDGLVAGVESRERMWRLARTALQIRPLRSGDDSKEGR